MENPRPHRSYLPLLALLSTGVFALCWLFPQLLDGAGLGPSDRWFMDTHTLLGSMEADWRGLDAYSYNAITMPHWYSHWWFVLGWAQPTQAATRWVGPLISGSALIAAWLVLRPRTLRELRWSLIVLCSPPLLLGFHRANADLLLFALLALCAPLMTSSIRFWRIAGAPLLIALATGLKYYPGTAGLVLLAVRPARDRTWALVAGAGLLVLTVIDVAPDLVHYVKDEPISGFYTFGAAPLFPVLNVSPPVGVLLSLASLGVVGWALLQRTGLRTWSPPAELRTDYLAFILGAVILTGCFVVTMNYVYRWVFLIGMIPFLCRLEVVHTHPTIHQLQKATRLLIGLALWTEVPVVTILNLVGTSQRVIDNWEDWTTAFQQIVTWSLFSCLSAWLAHFVISQMRIAPEQKTAAAR